MGKRWWWGWEGGRIVKEFRFERNSKEREEMQKGGRKEGGIFRER